ncbi:MAG: hypothetical protein OXN25_05305 [Candidatus Poribacteria bacterium]|nr:hypothetical protein [Candidatus Poribacteria bacterium]
MLNKKIWLPILIVLLIVIGIGVWRGQQAANQAPIKVYKPVEVEKTEVPPKVNDETAQGGHFHEDGTFHTEPHEANGMETPTSGEAASERNDPLDESGASGAGSQREGVALDPLTSEERKALEAKIQQLRTEYNALARISQPKTTQSRKLLKEAKELQRKQEVLSAEMSAIRTDKWLLKKDKWLLNKEKERREAPLFEEWKQLGDLVTSKIDRSEVLDTEVIKLLEQQKAISKEIEALRDRLQEGQR